MAYLDLTTPRITHSHRCPLTAQGVNAQVISSPFSFYYETEKTGKVYFSDLAFVQAETLSDEEKQILTGICRNKTINGQEPEMIKLAMLGQLKDQDVPYAFDAKCRHFLNYLYQHGGEQHAEHDIDSNKDSPITYSSVEEFERVVKVLKKRRHIDYENLLQVQSTTLYDKLCLTDEGLAEIKKALPKSVMNNLASQEMKVGDFNIDRQIEHSRKLFFGEQSTFESKRSACETLCFVLEPLRDELKNMFSGETESFFNVVNNFNIRHNKQRTMAIEHEEQLEWVFYSLLNTINTYFKLKNKLIA
ncbi:MAG TPA: hypothetical protein VK492_08300 [Chitinophagaceae bacterium]|nr:hypothetical protein [Chitinophagaceae bacterium]